MIPLHATHQGETYTATQQGSEIRLIVRKDQPDGFPGRGEMLARAMDARWPFGTPFTYFLTPARAEKWRVLWSAGANARQRGTRFANKEWVFVIGEDDCLPRHEAVTRAKAILKQREAVAL